MGNIFLRVKGIIKKDDKYLVMKRWMNDRIPDPFVWEFIDSEVDFAEKPDAAVCRAITELLGVEGSIEKILYTWSQMLGDTQCVGIVYLCNVDSDEFVFSEDFGGYEWIKRAEFKNYIENQYVLQDLEGVEL